jgi:hypothetical protein
MSFLEQVTSPTRTRGLDVLERIADDRGWFLERQDNGDLFMQTEGSWCSYSIHFTWNAEYQSLHINCCMDMRLPVEKRNEVNALLADINAKLWIGHFSIGQESLMPTYRHTLLMLGAEAIKSLEIENIIETALGECDRFYPAFQFVVWGGKSAREAMDCALLECVGEA